MSHVDGETVRQVSTEGFAPADYNSVGSSLDECVQKIIDAFANERTASWDAGDALNEAISNLTPNADQEPLFRWLATQTGCTVNRMKQLAAVSRTFEPGMRDLERAWSWHRAIYNAARRNNCLPADILATATEKKWTQRELDAHGTTRERVEFKGDCGDCGLNVHVICKKPGARAMLKGDRLTCPFCAATVAGTPYLGTLS